MGHYDHNQEMRQYGSEYQKEDRRVESFQSERWRGLNVLGGEELVG